MIGGRRQRPPGRPGRRRCTRCRGVAPRLARGPAAPTAEREAAVARARPRLTLRGRFAWPLSTSANCISARRERTAGVTQVPEPARSPRPTGHGRRRGARGGALLVAGTRRSPRSQPRSSSRWARPPRPPQWSPFAVESDLRGHDSHGVRRLIPYAGLGGPHRPRGDAGGGRRDASTAAADGWSGRRRTPRDSPLEVAAPRAPARHRGGGDPPGEPRRPPR